MHDNITISPTRRKITPSHKVAFSEAETFNNTELQQSVFNSAFYTAHSETYQAVYILIKRGIDVFVSIVMIVVCLPLIALIAILVKATSSGPVIFKHRRIGKFGVEFDCWKFRTMISDAEEVLKKDPKMLKQFNEKFKVEDDPRITKIGNFLRRSSLDELPQLVQILQGKMTFIGPRPVIKRELDKYSVYQNKLLSVKPGLSGLWQVSGRSETTYSERILLDMDYIDRRSLSLDALIFIKTFFTVLKKNGAC